MWTCGLLSRLYEFVLYISAVKSGWLFFSSFIDCVQNTKTVQKIHIRFSIVFDPCAHVFLFFSLRWTFYSFYEIKSTWRYHNNLNIIYVSRRYRIRNTENKNDFWLSGINSEYFFWLLTLAYWANVYHIICACVWE